MNMENKRKKGVAIIAAFCAITFPGSIYAISGIEADENVIATDTRAKVLVQGVVVDEAGIPVIGANVLVKGTAYGTTTDIDGNFSLPDVSDSATLVVSYIGFQTIEVKAASDLRIVLKEDAELLDEVVVVGYGTMRRKDVTSSISTVQADDLNQGVYTDPAQLLQGKVAGLTITQSSDPNQSSTITLRGASTLREGAAMEPYYIVDGVPGVDLSFVAPDDIETIDVLRDATATAIYGSKAATALLLLPLSEGKRGVST